MMLHTYNPLPMSLPSINFLLVGGRLDECSINRQSHGTIAFGH